VKVSAIANTHSSLRLLGHLFLRFSFRTVPHNTSDAFKLKIIRFCILFQILSAQKDKGLLVCKGVSRVLSPGLSIACGVLTATGFGTADFVAKLSTERVGFLRTALFMQVIGSFFVLPFALTDASRLLIDPWTTFAAVLLRVVNALGTLSLYKGFEVGRLSIVSPIASTAPVVAMATWMCSSRQASSASSTVRLMNPQAVAT
jgi:uncharacterized membrane protein